MLSQLICQYNINDSYRKNKPLHSEKERRGILSLRQGQEQAPLSSEQQDNLATSTKEVRRVDDVLPKHGVSEAVEEARPEERHKLSYRELVTRNQTSDHMEEDDVQEGDCEDDDASVSDDDMANGEEDGPWFLSV